jgi:hypothetical protein
MDFPVYVLFLDGMRYHPGLIESVVLDSLQAECTEVDVHLQQVLRDFTQLFSRGTAPPA